MSRNMFFSPVNRSRVVLVIKSGRCCSPFLQLPFQWRLRQAVERALLPQHTKLPGKSKEEKAAQAAFLQSQCPPAL